MRARWAGPRRECMAGLVSRRTRAAEAPLVGRQHSDADSGAHRREASLQRLDRRRVHESQVSVPPLPVPDGDASRCLERRRRLRRRRVRGARRMAAPQRRSRVAHALVQQRRRARTEVAHAHVVAEQPDKEVALGDELAGLPVDARRAEAVLQLEPGPRRKRQGSVQLAQRVAARVGSGLDRARGRPDPREWKHRHLVVVRPLALALTPRRRRHRQRRGEQRARRQALHQRVGSHAIKLGTDRVVKPREDGHRRPPAPEGLVGGGVHRETVVGVHLGARVEDVERRRVEAQPDDELKRRAVRRLRLLHQPPRCRKFVPLHRADA